MLRRRLLLLVGIAAAFAMLAPMLSQGAQSLLTRGGHEALVIAVVGEGGEAESLVKFAENLSDITEYCSFVSDGEETAMQKLSRGEVTAVLMLPENFVGGILTGENNPAILHVDPHRPAESMLTLYAGQCAADMLSAAQGGIYAVLNELSREGIVRESAVMEINIEYIKFTMARGSMYEEETVQLTQGLPIGEHYALSLLGWLLLMSSVIFYPALCPVQGDWRERLKSLGCTPLDWALGAFCPVLCCELLLTAAFSIFAGSFSVTGVLFCALFSAAFAGVICALSRTEAMAAALGFAASAGMALLSGSIIPQALMPKALRGAADYIPLTYMRKALGGGSSWELLAFGVAFALIALWLLARAYERQVQQ